MYRYDNGDFEITITESYAKGGGKIRHDYTFEACDLIGSIFAYGVPIIAGILIGRAALSILIPFICRIIEFIL